MPTDYSTDFWPQETLRQTPTPKPPPKKTSSKSKQSINLYPITCFFFPQVLLISLPSSQATPWRHPSPSLFHSGKAARCVASPGAAERPGAGARNGSAATGGAMAPSAPRGHRRPSGARWREPGYQEMVQIHWAFQIFQEPFGYGSIPIKIPFLVG